MSVCVITDSACDLPAPIAADLGVRIVPITVRFGTEELVDDDPQAFWRHLHLSGDLPETTPPPAHRFESEIKEAHNHGATSVVILSMSAAISATYTSAVIAAERVADLLPVRVVDTRTVSMAQGFAAMAAAELAQAGADVDTVAAEGRRVSASSHLLAALNTLEYLERGGRIGSLSAFIGNVMQVKPLLTLRNGVVEAAGRVRTRRAALDAIAEHVLGAPTLRDVAVVHGHASDLHYLIDALAPRVRSDRLIEAALGPVIATHTGPGVLGVAYRTA